MVASIEQEMLMQSQEMPSTPPTPDRPRGVPKLRLNSQKIVSRPIIQERLDTGSGLPTEEDVDWDLEHSKTSPSGGLRGSGRSNKFVREFVFDEQESAQELLEVAEDQINQMNVKAAQSLQTRAARRDPTLSISGKAINKFEEREPHSMGKLNLPGLNISPRGNMVPKTPQGQLERPPLFSQSDAKLSYNGGIEATPQFRYTVGRAILAARKKLEQQNDQIYCLEVDLEKAREDKIRLSQGDEIQNRQLDQLWERCNQLERERDNLAEALEASQKARNNFEEMWLKTDQERRRVTNLKDIELERDRLTDQRNRLKEEMESQAQRIDWLELCLKEKERLVSMKTPDTTEVVEKFIQQSARRSSRASVLVTPEPLNLKPRNDSEDINEYKFNELRNQNESSLDEYELASPQPSKTAFSDRFQDFLNKYKQKRETPTSSPSRSHLSTIGRIDTFQNNWTQESGEEEHPSDQIRVPLSELQQDILKIMQGWQNTEAKSKEYQLKVKWLEKELTSRRKGEVEWREKYELLDMQTRLLLTRRPPGESFATSMVSKRPTVAQNLGGFSFTRAREESSSYFMEDSRMSLNPQIKSSYRGAQKQHNDSNYYTSPALPKASTYSHSPPNIYQGQQSSQYQGHRGYSHHRQASKSKPAPTPYQIRGSVDSTFDMGDMKEDEEGILYLDQNIRLGSQHSSEANTPHRRAPIDLSEFHPPSPEMLSANSHSQSSNFNLMISGMSLKTAVQRQLADQQKWYQHKRSFHNKSEVSQSEGKVQMESSDSEYEAMPERIPTYNHTPSYTRTPTPNSLIYVSNPMVLHSDIRKQSHMNDQDKIFPLITEEVDSRLGTIMEAFPDKDEAPKTPEPEQINQQFNFKAFDDMRDAVNPKFTSINQALQKEASKFNIPSSFDSPSNLMKGQGLENFRTAQFYDNKSVSGKMSPSITTSPNGLPPRIESGGLNTAVTSAALSPEPKYIKDNQRGIEHVHKSQLLEIQEEDLTNMNSITSIDREAGLRPSIVSVTHVQETQSNEKEKRTDSNQDQYKSLHYGFEGLQSTDAPTQQQDVQQGEAQDRQYRIEIKNEVSHSQPHDQLTQFALKYGGQGIKGGFQLKKTEIEQSDDGKGGVRRMQHPRTAPQQTLPLGLDASLQLTGNLRVSPRGDQIESLHQIPLSAINIDSSRQMFLEGSSLIGGTSSQTPKSQIGVLSPKSKGDTEFSNESLRGKKTGGGASQDAEQEEQREQEEGGHQTARFPNTYENSMIDEVRKTEETMKERLESRGGKVTQSPERLRFNKSLSINEPEKFQERTRSQMQSPEHKYSPHARSMALNRFKPSIGGLHDQQMKTFEENYKQLKIQYDKLKAQPAKSRVKIMKFYQQAMLPLMQDLQRRAAESDFDFALLQNSMVSSKEHMQEFKEDDQYLEQRGMKEELKGLDNQRQKSKPAIFSDKVDYFKDFKTRERRFLFIRGAFLYFYHYKTLQRLTRIPLSHIEHVFLIRRSAELILLYVKGYHPYLLQSIHRLELAVFLAQQRKRLGLPPLRPLFKERLLVTRKGMQVDELIPSSEIASVSKSGVIERSVVGPNQSVVSLNNNKTQKRISKLAKIVSKFNFSNAERRGLLWVLRNAKGMLRPAKWQEKVVVLTRVGFFVFKDLQDQSPFFFPLINSSIFHGPSLPDTWPQFPKELLRSVRAARELEPKGREPLRPPLLQLRLLDLKPLTIAFPSFAERDRWAQTIHELQEKYEEQENKLLNLKT